MLLMDNQLKHRITRIFRSSFESCRSKHITDVIESAVLPATAANDDHHHHQLIHLFSPKKHTPPSFPCCSNCKPKLPDSFNTDDSCIVRKKSFCLFSDNREKLQLQLLDGQKCPPASPITPFFNFQNQNPPKNRVKKRNSKRGSRRIRSSRTRSYGMNDFPACSYNGLFSSDDEDDEDEHNDDEDDDDDNTTFFSSRSLSSESSRSFRQEKKGRRSRRVIKEIGVKGEGKEKEESCGTEEEEEEDSFAVVKRSNDPYNDFRTSMEEMIIEKQIFIPNDLEHLLHCFLSLNSSRHHRVILQVFKDISEALFS